MALLLTEQGQGGNQFQSVFGTLYRRFLVSSYKEIQQQQFAGVLAFLDEWMKAAAKEVAGDDDTTDA